MVKEGDRIVQINNVCDSAAVLAAELKRKAILSIKVRRVDFDIGDSVLGIRPNGNWYPASIVEDNRDGTFLLQWHDGREDDRIKGLLQLKKEDEMQDACHKK